MPPKACSRAFGRSSEALRPRPQPPAAGRRSSGGAAVGSRFGGESANEPNAHTPGHPPFGNGQALARRARPLASARPAAWLVPAGVPAADRDAHRRAGDRPRHSGESVRRHAARPPTAPPPPARAGLGAGATPPRSSPRLAQPKNRSAHPEPPAHPLPAALPRPLRRPADPAAAAPPASAAALGAVRVTTRTEISGRFCDIQPQMDSSPISWTGAAKAWFVRCCARRCGEGVGQRARTVRQHRRSVARSEGRSGRAVKGNAGMAPSQADLAEAKRRVLSGLAERAPRHARCAARARRQISEAGSGGGGDRRAPDRIARRDAAGRRHRPAFGGGVRDRRTRRERGRSDPRPPRWWSLLYAQHRPVVPLPPTEPSAVIAARVTAARANPRPTAVGPKADDLLSEAERRMAAAWSYVQPHGYTYDLPAR